MSPNSKRATATTACINETRSRHYISRFASNNCVGKNLHVTNKMASKPKSYLRVNGTASNFLTRQALGSLSCSQRSSCNTSSSHDVSSWSSTVQPIEVCSEIRSDTPFPDQLEDWRLYCLPSMFVSSDSNDSVNVDGSYLKKKFDIPILARC